MVQRRVPESAIRWPGCRHVAAKSVLLSVLMLAATGCAGSRPMVRGAVAVESLSSELRGEASWYGPGFAGRSTASGEMFDPSGFTAAHRTLPLGAVVRVVREDTRQWVVVRINDRGPFVRGRVVDLSEAAAREIEMIERGHVPVYIEVLLLPDSTAGTTSTTGGRT